MTDWNKAYGPDANAYPVQPGEVWTVGPHSLACLDLEDPTRSAAWMDLVVRQGRCAMGFSDPPWNAGNARSFRTKAQADGDKGRAVDFSGLMNRVLTALAWAVSPGGPVWIEMGNAQAAEVRAMLAQSWPLTEEWPVTYYGSKPCTLLRGATGGPSVGADGPAGVNDMLLPAFAIARDSLPGDRVYDPCTGRGLTAVSAAAAGRVFWGSELNPRRLSVTLAKLHRVTGAAPARVAVL